MMESKWIVPAVAGIMLVSLVGCGARGTTAEPTPGSSLSTVYGTDQDYTATRSSVSPYEANPYGTRTGVTTERTGSRMMEDAHYYADGDGALTGAEDHLARAGRDAACRGREMMSDVERAMDDVGQTMRHQLENV